VQGHFTASLIATDYENTAQRASLTSLDDIPLSAILSLACLLYNIRVITSNYL